VEGSGGWGPERISARDVEVLGFVARFGVVPRDAVARWAGSGKSMTVRRVQRLRKAALLEVLKPWSEPVLIATRDGLAACGHDDLFPARLSLTTLRHFSVVAHLAADLESAGEQLLSERELRCHERAMGEREFSIRLPNGRHHRPDLILQSGLPTPIEVELSPKGSLRLDQIIAAWSAAVDAGRFAEVRYLCSEEALPYVQRSVGRTGAGGEVEVEPLPEECLIAAEQLA
jgi:hypothetical protein